jgi:hypothetical protein
VGVTFEVLRISAGSGLGSAVRCRTQGALAPEPLHAGDRLHIRVTMTARQGFSIQLAPLPHPRTTTVAYGVAAGTAAHGSPTGARR